MRTLLTLFVLSISALYTSCRTCTLKKCSDYYELRLSGFSQPDLDGACRITETGCIQIGIDASEDESYYYITDFEVTESTPAIFYQFPATGKTYMLSNFTFDEHECNECTFGKDLYLQFSGCKVDGVSQRGNIIQLMK